MRERGEPLAATLYSSGFLSLGNEAPELPMLWNVFSAAATAGVFLAERRGCSRARGLPRPWADRETQVSDHRGALSNPNQFPFSDSPLVRRPSLRTPAFKRAGEPLDHSDMPVMSASRAAHATPRSPAYSSTR